jgi:hypothetical protein
MTKTWAPIAFAIADLFTLMSARNHDLDILAAFDVMTAAQGCGVRPVVADGDLIGRYLQLLFGSPTSASADIEETIVHEPPVVAKLVLKRSHSISLRQFAESFDGAAIRAMHKLMRSPRLDGVDVDTVVHDFEREMHDFNGRRRMLDKASYGIDAIVALASLSSGWGLLTVAAAVMVKHLLARSVLTDEKAARLVGSPKEAAYLARINRTMSGD